MNKKSHYENCRDCKEYVRRFLAVLFGAVEVNRNLDIPSRLEDYKSTSLYEHLDPIYQTLQQNRGHYNFVKRKKLSPVDFYIPERQFIIEFDESQHFTKPREIALRMYPEKLEYGFPVERWCSLCHELDRHDNDPPYRDEQRAWYDTLRDHAPILWNAGATFRLYARDAVWCSLDPDNDVDLRTFEQLLSQGTRSI